MLRSIKDLERYTVSAEDGDIGEVSDFYFDDARWTVRYLVTETGSFFNERKVLISPIAFRQASWETRRFHVALTRDKVRHSPDIDLAQPVSRQREREYSQYFGWPDYWGYPSDFSWGAGPLPEALIGASPPVVHKGGEAGDDPHLRSARVVTGYGVDGTDGEIGHIADLVVDDESWDIRYLVVDTSNWFMGHKVLVAPRWAGLISWEASKVSIGLTREAIRQCPPWDPAAPVNREYETRMYDYYGRPVYWESPAEAESRRRAATQPPTQPAP